jgi:hypothetical protein
VTIAPRSKSYGTISRGQTGVNTFTLTVPTTQGLGVPVVFRRRRSTNPLGPLTGAEVDGRWTFSVVDSDKTGFIRAVSLHLNGC